MPLSLKQRTDELEGRWQSVKARSDRFLARNMFGKRPEILQEVAEIEQELLQIRQDRDVLNRQRIHRRSYVFDLWNERNFKRSRRYFHGKS